MKQNHILGGLYTSQAMHTKPKNTQKSSWSLYHGTSHTTCVPELVEVDLGEVEVRLLHTSNVGVLGKPAIGGHEENLAHDDDAAGSLHGTRHHFHGLRRRGLQSLPRRWAAPQETVAAPVKKIAALRVVCEG